MVAARHHPVFKSVFEKAMGRGWELRENQDGGEKVGNSNVCLAWLESSARFGWFYAQIVGEDVFLACLFLLPE